MTTCNSSSRASEARLRTAMSEFKFVGPWTESGKYRHGNIVTQGGAIYCFNVDGASSRPGVGGDGYFRTHDHDDFKEAAMRAELERWKVEQLAEIERRMAALVKSMLH
jgi:hypothetical protein